jgi:thymidylate synthase ThyX
MFEPCIKATVIQDSVSAGIRITTLELEYPRFIHAELMTHRQFSRNAASSRAIPIEKMIQHVLEHPAAPIHWGANQAGMQAKAELLGILKLNAKETWKEAIRSATKWARELAAIGLHKQIANRVTEPFQIMKTIVTATEWDNWFWLREHPDAQPEIHELARQMRLAMEDSEPLSIVPNEWHVPYVDRDFEPDNHDIIYMIEGKEVTLDEARMISASCCAQVSYRKTDDSLDKAKMVFDRLINSEPVHASPVEHQASPMMRHQTFLGDDGMWEAGITHMDRKGRYWSGNFKGWIQFRQLIPNNAK